MLWIGVVHEYEYGERDAFIAILISRFENLMLVLKVGLEKFLLHFTGSLLQVELNFACSCTCMSDFYHPRAAQKKKRWCNLYLQVYVPSRLDRVEQDIFDSLVDAASYAPSYVPLLQHDGICCILLYRCLTL